MESALESQIARSFFLSLVYIHTQFTLQKGKKYKKTRMWANAQRDGRPAEYRWRPLFNAAKFG